MRNSDELAKDRQPQASCLRVTYLGNKVHDGFGCTAQRLISLRLTSRGLVKLSSRCRL